MLTSTIVALATLPAAFFMLLAALWVVVRGSGRIAVLRQELMVLSTALEQVEIRLTREVKTRAGLSRAENAAEERSVAEQATAILQDQPTVVPISGRPKRQFRRN